MVITLYNTASESNAVNKVLSNGLTLTGTFRDTPSVINPILLINATNPALFNYAYIPDYGRYYFIDNIKSIRTDIWELTLRCDVLMSHKAGILASTAVIDESESVLTGVNRYIANEAWATLVKDKTDIITFPNGLLDTGEYILITAGGDG